MIGANIQSIIIEVCTVTYTDYMVQCNGLLQLITYSLSKLISVQVHVDSTTPILSE